jgi:lysozyme family protein
MKEFFLVLSIIFQLEGGWTEIDGGTNYGIKASTLARANDLKIVQTQDIKKLTRREAAVIYYKLYWIPSGAYKYSYPLNLVMLDAAVHMGAGEAGKILRVAMQNASSKSVRQVSTQYVLERYQRLRSLKQFSKYKTGWRRRMRIVARYVMLSSLPETHGGEYGNYRTAIALCA